MPVNSCPRAEAAVYLLQNVDITFKFMSSLTFMLALFVLILHYLYEEYQRINGDLSSNVTSLVQDMLGLISTIEQAVV